MNREEEKLINGILYELDELREAIADLRARIARLERDMDQVWSWISDHEEGLDQE